MRLVDHLSHTVHDGLVTYEGLPPPLFHCLDVAACADALLEASPAWLVRLARAVESSPASLRTLLVQLVALHDIGKLSESSAATSTWLCRSGPTATFHRPIAIGRFRRSFRIRSTAKSRHSSACRSGAPAARCTRPSRGTTASLRRSCRALSGTRSAYRPVEHS